MERPIKSLIHLWQFSLRHLLDIIFRIVIKSCNNCSSRKYFMDRKQDILPKWVERRLFHYSLYKKWRNRFRKETKGFALLQISNFIKPQLSSNHIYYPKQSTVTELINSKSLNFSNLHVRYPTLRFFKPRYKNLLLTYLRSFAESVCASHFIQSQNQSWT